MRPDDLPEVLSVQAQAYGSAMLESEAALASRLHLSPATCWVTTDAMDVMALANVDARHAPARAATSNAERSRVAGYLFTHPWQIAAPPPLDTVLDTLPDAPDCWYVHDMALAPRTRAAGVASRLYAAALESARGLGLQVSALVAVQQSQGFWARFGYAVATDVSPLIAAKLAGYGDGAVFMTRRL
ncbi:GNAT family N-acetyltransferase [Pandoraea nosoerga]|uniref:GNAT family N-acetyltransferase n=1 Tax=Pandoraea nosoerga TaxID=2508296 RepID=A0A5E4VME7_9BURK|nr:GNAT family N-acetyltransferase [Pandoraea nosoerga]MBN4666799.1 GNAT family N-acetyltransferase [Pandoraea nosoerga]MBN4677829.1 GNAT family N-acetyltransferase [Pandoraea nosoerga]MBN4683004.1 GNAT family N-acetyltransferase [Pandoraea nosoerga]MBN4746086.1 GNAT family N-acetyltransferase [Pandoraea nosoerga]VVE13508.1 GNAT family N-acetyltransferase [Pandoraea nosoerga]